MTSVLNTLPLGGDNPNVVELKMDDVLNKVAEKMAQREAQNTIEEKPSVEAANSTNNKGCMGVLAILILPLVLYSLMF